MRVLRWFGGVLSVALIAASAAHAAPVGSISEPFVGGVTAGFTAGGGPSGIAEGPDGNMWITESGVTRSRG